MSLVENLLNRLNIRRSREDAATRKIGIVLWDLRGLKEEERKGFDPGFYFKIGPVPVEVAKQPDFLEKLIPNFTQMLHEQGFSKGEEFKEPISRDGTVVAGPTWRYTEVGYYDDFSTLVVQAEPLDSKVLENIPIDYMRKQALSATLVQF